jgi:hypothetical protein
MKKEDVRDLDELRRWVSKEAGAGGAVLRRLARRLGVRMETIFRWAWGHNESSRAGRRMIRGALDRLQREDAVERRAREVET